MRKQTKQNTYSVLQPSLALLVEVEIRMRLLAVRDALPHPKAHFVSPRCVGASEIHA